MDQAIGFANPTLLAYAAIAGRAAMGEVKRYTLSAFMDEREDGLYVDREDYDAVERERDALRADLQATREALHEWDNRVGRLQDEVAKLTAACAAKDGVIIRFLNAPLAQRDGTPVPSLLLASARAALSDTAGAGWIDATGAVEGKVAQGHLSTRQVWTAKDAFPDDWAGDTVKIVRVKP